jgi:two-component system, NarL family, nitrate/nitrite response regulator NarL
VKFIPTIIVEKRTLLREGITSLLRDAAYKVVSSVASMSEIPELRLTPGLPALAILGLRSGLDETLQAVQSLRKIVPDGKIVAIGERYGHLDFKEILNCGVDGIVFNIDSGEALLKVFDLVFLRQQVVIFDHTAHSVPHHQQAPLLAPTDLTTITATKSETETRLMTSSLGLTGREQQVLLCIARGEANKKIAHSCSITEGTVKVHVKAILRKISVQNRTQAALWAAENCSFPMSNSHVQRNERNAAATSDSSANRPIARSLSQVNGRA